MGVGASSPDMPSIKPLYHSLANSILFFTCEDSNPSTSIANIGILAAGEIDFEGIIPI
jgi:hypothetical protein